MIVLAALTGCMPGAPPASPQPTQASGPTRTPTPAPRATPTASASPSASAPAGDDHAGARYCGDEYVLSLVRSGIVGWEGGRLEVLEMAQPQPTFEPNDLLLGLGVVCVVTFRVPTDDPPDVAIVSVAMLERDDDVFAALDTWASEHYYELRTRETGFTEREAPPNADGTSTRKIFWAPIDGDDPVIDNAADIVRLTGAAPDAVLLVHADFTQE